MEKHQFHVEKVHLLFDSVAMKKEIQVSLAWEGPDTYPVMKMREGKKRRLATSAPSMSLLLRMPSTLKSFLSPMAKNQSC